MPTAVKKDGVILSKSSKPAKKYKAVFPDGMVVHFGHSSYPQYKDSTGLGLYSHKDHKDLARRDNFHMRHGCAQKSKKTAGYLSCKYLW